MKTSIATISFLAALAALPATVSAQTPVSAGTTAQATSPHKAVGPAIDELSKKAVGKTATKEDYTKLSEQIGASLKPLETEAPAITALRTRLQARIEEIEQRARAGAVDAQDFDAVRDALIDADLEVAIHRLRAAARAGKYSLREYQSILDALNARAAAAKAGNPELDAIANRAKAAIEALKGKDAASVKETDVQPIVDIIAEWRTMYAVQTLEHKALNKKSLKSDFDDVVAQVRATSGEDIAKKVEARLAELRAAVEGGRITKEQFADLKAMLMTRARAASSGK
jgi:aminoglycoside phosphotransferase